MPESNIGIVILAAGGSRRMGKPKQLIKIRGISLIRRAAKTALDSACHPVVVVLGANAEQIRPELKQLGLGIALNDNWNEGLSTSIRCGLNLLLLQGAAIEAVVLMVADQPNISVDSIRKLLEAYDPKSGLVASEYKGVIGTPALFSRQYFAGLFHLEGQEGARKLLDRHREKVIRVELPEAAMDLDSPEDLTAFLNHDPTLTHSSPLHSDESSKAAYAPA